ncbi:MAG: DegT/DnrJ/EryC1/StrS family aminotransferase [Arcobacteraceae bacterium]
MSLQTKDQKLKTNIDFANLQYQHELYKDEIENAILKVARNCNFIMGNEVQELEKSLEEFTGAKYAVSCSNGTDALLLAMMALDIKPGDEVITTPFTFIATAETIAFLGAIPVFVDIDEKTYNIDPTKIEAAITDKTKAIIPVSLYGQPADMDAIQSIVDKTLKTNNQKLYTIIDGAQSFGSTYNGKTDSNLGDISTTSFFPAKPLGCYGDGGAVFTNDQKLATKIQSLRLHGQSKRYHHQYIGMGGRLDTIQAAILNVKLKYYPKDLALRQEVASKYDQAFSQKFLVSSKETKNKQLDISTKNEKLETNNYLITPFVSDKCTSSWAQYSIRIKNRDEVQKRLSSLSELKTKNQKPKTNIPTAVHYPMPLHLQECFSYLGYKKGDFPISEIVSQEIMSLPMNPYVSDEEIEYIVNEVLNCIH